MSVSELASQKQINKRLLEVEENLGSDYEFVKITKELSVEDYCGFIPLYKLTERQCFIAFVCLKIPNVMRLMNKKPSNWIRQQTRLDDIIVLYCKRKWKDAIKKLEIEGTNK